MMIDCCILYCFADSITVSIIGVGRFYLCLDLISLTSFEKKLKTAHWSQVNAIAITPKQNVPTTSVASFIPNKFESYATLTATPTTTNVPTTATAGNAAIVAVLEKYKKLL